jgi:REP element-mobilizing transposase RayT
LHLGVIYGTIDTNKPTLKQMDSEQDLFEHQHIAFFTATILEWKRLLIQDKYKQIILDSLSFLVEQKRIVLYGFVLMPNHIHLLWRIQPLYHKEEVQRDFLKFTAQKIIADLKKHHPKVLELFYVNTKDRKYQIWERNPLSVYCFSNAVTEQKLNYIHQNPLQEKWSLAETPEAYQYSSASFYIENRNDYSFLSNYLQE